MDEMETVVKNEKNIVVTPTVFSGQTETMKTSWADLQSLQKQPYLKIILGNQKDWKAKGGDKITQEIQASLDAHK